METEKYVTAKIGGNTTVSNAINRSCIKFFRGGKENLNLLSPGEIYLLEENGQYKNIYVGSEDGSEPQYINQNEIENLDQRIKSLFDFATESNRTTTDILKNHSDNINHILDGQVKYMKSTNETFDFLNNELRSNRSVVAELILAKEEHQSKIRFATIVAVFSFLEINVLFFLQCLGIL